jgi:hypothetical protein
MKRSGQVYSKLRDYVNIKIEDASMREETNMSEYLDIDSDQLYIFFLALLADTTNPQYPKAVAPLVKENLKFYGEEHLKVLAEAIAKMAQLNETSDFDALISEVTYWYSKAV